MNVSGNIRYQFIEEVIEKSVLSLLKRRSYDGYTVKDICAEAGINRSTFYAHFDDINDLMIKLESKMAKNINLIFKPVSDETYTEEVFVMMFNFVKENKSFYKAFLRGNFGVPVESEMIKKIQPHFQSLVLKRGINYSENEIVYHMCFFAGGLKLICAKWLEHDCKESPTEMARIIADEYCVNSKFFVN